MRILKLLIFLLPMISLQGQQVFLEAKGAYFQPAGKNFQNTYGGGGLYGAEVTCQAKDNLYVWASGDYFRKSGDSICQGVPTHIYFIPIGLGLKYLQPIPSTPLILYAGAGALGTYVHAKDCSPYVGTVSKWGFGGIGKVGLLILGEHFFLDLFTNYLAQYIHGSSSSDPIIYGQKANLSGWAFGAGLGCYF